jgi:hypothetical protein
VRTVVIKCNCNRNVQQIQSSSLETTIISHATPYTWQCERTVSVLSNRASRPSEDNLNYQKFKVLNSVIAHKQMHIRLGCMYRIIFDIVHIQE